MGARSLAVEDGVVWLNIRLLEDGLWRGENYLNPKKISILVLTDHNRLELVGSGKLIWVGIDKCTPTDFSVWAQTYAHISVDACASRHEVFLLDTQVVPVLKEGDELEAVVQIFPAEGKFIYKASFHVCVRWNEENF